MLSPPLGRRTEPEALKLVVGIDRGTPIWTPKYYHPCHFGPPEKPKNMEIPKHKSLLAVPCQREDKSNVSSAFLVVDPSQAIVRLMLRSTHPKERCKLLGPNRIGLL